MNERIIIGECDRAGLAISAPTDTGTIRPDKVGDVRWVQRDGYFALQQYREVLDDSNEWRTRVVPHWVDVCVSKEGV